MTIIQIILTAVLLIIVLLSFRKGRDLFSPGKVFLIVWSASIILAEFKFSGFQHTWSVYSWMVLFIGLVSFLLGTYAAYTLFADKKIKSVLNVRSELIRKSENENLKLFYTILILFAVYIFSYILEVMIIGNVPIFSRRMDEARSEYGVFGLHLIVNFQIAIMFLNIEYMILFKGSRIHRIINILVFIITLLTFALLLQRFNFFIWGVMTLTFLYYASNKLRFRNILIIAAVFFGFLYAIQSIRVSQYVEAFIYVTSKMKFSKDYAIFSEPYMYITMNLENMARAVDRLEFFSFGSLTGDWILALTGIKRWVLELFNINARPFLVSGYNTFPFLWNYYSDFGVTGVFIFPLLTGFFISVIYYIMRITGEVKWIVFYANAIVLIVISFFTNPLTMLNYTACSILLWFLHKFVLGLKKS